MKIKKLYFLIVLFLCGLSVKNGFAAAPAAGHLGRELIAAIREGDETEVENLIAAGADVNAADGIGFTPLMVAAQRGHENIMNMLLDAGADLNATNLGYTALMYAAMRDNADIVKLLLSRGADKNKKIVRGGYTAESFARMHKYHEIADLIRDYESGRRTKFAGKR